jgi:hypothetical protein
VVYFYSGVDTPKNAIKYINPMIAPKAHQRLPLNLANSRIKVRL